MTRLPAPRPARLPARAGLVALAAALAGAAAATPATAADTLVTFSVGTSGTLSLSAPASMTVAEAAGGGGSLTALLGDVTITDTRNNPLSSWAATASATDPRHSAGAATIPKANVLYSPGTPRREQGAAVVVPGTTTPTSLSAVLPVVTGTVTSGSTVTWAPTLEIRVPSGTPAGTYTMTVTHSVS